MAGVSRSIMMRRVVEMLLERGGAMKDKEIYEGLRKLHDISYGEFLRLLMILEINGYVHVETIGEDARAVNLNYRKIEEGSQ